MKPPRRRSPGSVQRTTERYRWSRYHNVPKHVYQDSRYRDRKRGLSNDLTLEFVQQELAKDCQYCGGRDGRMTLDRMDSTIGHLQSNVVASCERCNMLKKDMPFEAWLVLVPSVKEAFKGGLFGSWVGGPHSKKRQLPPPSLSALPPKKRKADKLPKPVKPSRYPPAKELEELLKTHTAVDLAKRFGVSSTALKKHCNRVGVGTPARGQFQKLKAEKVRKERVCKGCSKPVSSYSKTLQCSMCFNKSPEKREATRQQKLKFPTLPVDTERSRD